MAEQESMAGSGNPVVPFNTNRPTEVNPIRFMKDTAQDEEDNMYDFRPQPLHVADLPPDPKGYSVPAHVASSDSENSLALGEIATAGLEDILDSPLTTS